MRSLHMFWSVNSLLDYRAFVLVADYANIDDSQFDAQFAAVIANNAKVGVEASENIFVRECKSAR